MNPFKVISYPLATEKAVRLMEKENKLTFITDKKAGKMKIKKAIEQAFKIKIKKINTVIEKGQKKAYVELGKEINAMDMAIQLGIM